MRRLGAGQAHHPRRGFGRDWRFARLARLVTQQPVDPRLGEALLPPPHRRPTDAEALGNPLRWSPIRRSQHDARPFHMLLRPVAVPTIACSRSRSAVGRQDDRRSAAPERPPRRPWSFGHGDHRGCAARILLIACRHLEHPVAHASKEPWLFLPRPRFSHAKAVKTTHLHKGRLDTGPWRPAAYHRSSPVFGGA
jgi:hypothetical protein